MTICRKCLDFPRLHNGTVNEVARKFGRGGDEALKDSRSGMGRETSPPAALARQINPMGLEGQARPPASRLSVCSGGGREGPYQSLLRSKKRGSTLKAGWKAGPRERERGGKACKCIREPNQIWTEIRRILGHNLLYSTCCANTYNKTTAVYCFFRQEIYRQRGN